MLPQRPEGSAGLHLAEGSSPEAGTSLELPARLGCRPWAQTMPVVAVVVGEAGEVGAQMLPPPGPLMRTVTAGSAPCSVIPIWQRSQASVRPGSSRLAAEVVLVHRVSRPAQEGELA